MSDIADTLKGLLGDDAEDKIKSVMNSLSTDDRTDEGHMDIKPSASLDSMNQLMQLKNIMESMTMNRSDPRANLLLSLKPYMRDSRQSSVDNAVKIIGVLNIIKLLGQ